MRRPATAMQALGVAHVSATHCTGSLASHVFRTVFGDRYLDPGVGTVISLPFVLCREDTMRWGRSRNALPHFEG